MSVPLSGQSGVASASPARPEDALTEDDGGLLEHHRRLPPDGELPRWATNSSFFFYYESQHDPTSWGGGHIDVPIGVALFPKENPITGPREWAEQSYNIARWMEMSRGGHFPAAEEPELLAAELREFFRPLRAPAAE